MNTSGGGAGVYGTAARFGVYGLATGTSDTVGVFGSGVDGLQGAGTIHGVYASGQSYGIYAVTSNGTASTAGVYSNFYNASNMGSTGPWTIPYNCSGSPVTFCDSIEILNQAGVWADTGWDGDFPSQYAPALLATADENVAITAINSSSITPAAFFYNAQGGGASTGGIPPNNDADVVRAVGPRGSCSLTGTGDASCTGTLKSVVATTNGAGAGAQRFETYSVQSAENWFEDAGTAQLVNGTGRVNLESVFGQTVNTGVEYHVFLTPDGDCKGLYVSAKTASGFEVRELGRGNSNIAFEYRIMAKRVGYENVRLKNVTERFNKQAALGRKALQPARASAVQPK